MTCHAAATAVLKYMCNWLPALHVYLADMLSIVKVFVKFE